MLSSESTNQTKLVTTSQSDDQPGDKQAADGSGETVISGDAEMDGEPCHEVPIPTFDELVAEVGDLGVAYAIACGWKALERAERRARERKGQPPRVPAALGSRNDQG